MHSCSDTRVTVLPPDGPAHTVQVPGPGIRRVVARTARAAARACIYIYVCVFLERLNFVPREGRVQDAAVHGTEAAAVYRRVQHVRFSSSGRGRAASAGAAAWLCERAPLWVVVHVSGLLRGDCIQGCFPHDAKRPGRRVMHGLTCVTST
jgi:hypothetical protein